MQKKSSDRSHTYACAFSRKQLKALRTKITQNKLIFKAASSNEQSISRDSVDYKKPEKTAQRLPRSLRVPIPPTPSSGSFQDLAPRVSYLAIVIIPLKEKGRALVPLT
jgi:hypothetical protein